jgi:hypothetical protein
MKLKQSSKASIPVNILLVIFILSMLAQKGTTRRPFVGLILVIRSRQLLCKDTVTKAKTTVSCVREADILIL